MSYINVTNIQVKNNPALFSTPLTFNITFECLKEIPGEIEWKLVYVGSAKDEKYDQILDSFTMGPLQYGIMQFELESNAPDPSKIPQDDLIGVTAIILSISYKDQEFYRIGYYVYNNYTDPELLENSPPEIQIDKVYRNILADKPRLTKFDIKWGFEDEEMKQDLTETNVLKEINNIEDYGSNVSAGFLNTNNNNHIQNMMGLGNGSTDILKESLNAASNNPFLNINGFGGGFNNEINTINENSITSCGLAGFNQENIMSNDFQAGQPDKNPFL